MNRLSLLSCVGALALAGCGSAPTTSLDPPAPRLLVSQPQPETRPIWQCVHQRLQRYSLDDRADAAPVVVELSPWLVLIARAELPSSLTPVAEVLITEAGPKLKYVEGLRAQTLGEGSRFVSERDARSIPGLSRAPAVVRLNGSLQFGETSVESAGRGFNLGLFSTARDGSGNLSAQLTTASVTLVAASVDPATRTGGYGSASSVKVNYLRSESNDGSFAVSISSSALGWNNVKRLTYGPEAAVRLGMTVSMVESLSHTMRLPVNECLASVSKTTDTVPLELVLDGFRSRRAKDPQAAARWLNYSRAYFGAIASDPESLRNNASSTVSGTGSGTTVTLAPASPGISRAGFKPVLPADEALASLLARGATHDTVEVEFVTLYANLWRVPQATYDAGAAWVRAEQGRRIEAARIEGERIRAEQERVTAEQARLAQGKKAEQARSVKEKKSAAGPSVAASSAGAAGAKPAAKK
jgi:hypothetical protein